MLIILTVIEDILGEGVMAHMLMHSAPFSNFTVAAVLEAYPVLELVISGYLVYIYFILDLKKKQ